MRSRFALAFVAANVVASGLCLAFGWTLHKDGLRLLGEVFGLAGSILLILYLTLNGRLKIVR